MGEPFIYYRERMCTNLTLRFFIKIVREVVFLFKFFGSDNGLNPKNGILSSGIHVCILFVTNDDARLSRKILAIAGESDIHFSSTLCESLVSIKFLSILSSDSLDFDNLELLFHDNIYSFLIQTSNFKS